MEVEESLILQVPAESIIVGHTTRLTSSSSGDGAELCDIKKEKELLNSPETNPDKLNPWASLVTPEQTHSKTSPGQSPLIPARTVRPTLQQPPQLKVVGIQHLGRTRGRDRSQEEPVRSLAVSATLVQTKEGPRLVMEGLRGLQLDGQQVEEIRRIVVDQLYTVQVVARLEARIPPTRVSLTLRGQFTREPPTPSPPPQNQLCLNSSQQQPRLFARLPQNVIQHGQFVQHQERGSARVLLLPRNIFRAYQARLSGETTIKVCSASQCHNIQYIKSSMIISSLY